MTVRTSQYIPVHSGGARLAYEVNSQAIHCQITLGGRATGNTKIKYRPNLDYKDAGEDPTQSLTFTGEFETPADNVISFPADGGGAIEHTFVIPNRRLSYIEIDDSANVAGDDFWIHISQW